MWAASVEQRLSESWPDMPDGIEDRAADVWESLLAVADVTDSGVSVTHGGWSTRARVAAVAFVTDLQDRSVSLGIRLLEDVRAVFEKLDCVALATDGLLTELREIEEGPWDDLRGKPLDARGLARRLSAYEIKPKVVRIGEGTRRGYTREDMVDAWSRYLPRKCVTDVTAKHDPDAAALDLLTDQLCAVPIEATL